MSYLGRRPLALAIRAYRRWVSGRGPLRTTCCTFASTESCSAYGLRATQELAGSLPEALSLVRARVRSCRHTSIYRFARGFGWERAHELSPTVLTGELAARGERPDTIAQVLAARTVVARWRGERAFAAMPMRAQHRIPVRGGDATIRHHRRTMKRGLVLATIAALLVVVTGWALVPAVVAIAAALGARSSAQRLEQQRVASTFLRPAAT